MKSKIRVYGYHSLYLDNKYQNSNIFLACSRIILVDQETGRLGTLNCRAITQWKMMFFTEVRSLMGYRRLSINLIRPPALRNSLVERA